MDEYPNIERRRYHRLRYPEADRPSVRFDKKEFPVSEISEKGTKIVLPAGCSLEQHQPFTGILWFQDGVNILIRGVVQRCDKEGVAVKLSKGISVQRMIAEQSRLLEKYPNLFDASEAAENDPG